ncbi:hypothetical protein H2200_001032 [Cladophialophora chaetospira]|uniref:Uncharacterized protein n=1 Tax=Cladophialophora chaetospira TaxID=386627 RepID=A0AA38XPY6_9EURO|nr:hypothetical protein H2200_001032 [Cladophialophora chaetospira]
MPPKKKARNNKARKNQEEVPRPPTTVSCPKCSEDIIVPKTCKHGKKLLNCQGTGCTTAHLEEHNAHCTPPSAPTFREQLQATRKLVGEANLAMTPERLHAMGALTVQLNAVIKSRGGKPVRYLDGVPFTEWFAKIERGPIANVNEWVAKLKDVVEQKKMVEDVGYDDEESDGDGDACATPEDENEEDE